MPSCKHYTPVLKAKQGELSALNALDEATWSRITPLLEVTGQPYDYVSDRYAKTLEVHLGEVSVRISAAVKPGQPFFLDVPEGTDAGSGSRSLDGATQHFLAGLRTKDLSPIGVTGLDRPDTYHRAVAAAGGGEFCIRAPLDQFGKDESMAGQAVDRVCGVLGVRRSSVHMMIDLGAIGDSPNIGRSQWRMLVRGAIDELEGADAFASLTLVASSFPRDLSDMDAASEKEIPRDEWALWQSLVKGREDNPGVPRFGDYAVSHPQVLEMDPRFMRMSANIRYSTEYNWLLVKGRNVRDHGYEQFNDLSRLLVANPAFKGTGFSWGDKYIAACAADNEGPGNATTWRKVGTNHHITLVADQLSRMAGS